MKPKKRSRERAKDSKNALTLWELARTVEPVTFDFFARLSGAVRDSAAGKQAFYRFARWCIARGLPMEMSENAADFDREAALELALRLRPSLRRRAPTNKNKLQPPESNSAPLPEPLLSVKEVARLIGRRRDFVWRLLRRRPPPFPFVQLGRVKSVRLRDLQAWLDAHTVRPKKGPR